MTFYLRNLFKGFNFCTNKKIHKPFITQLENRALICVNGKDSKKLLQGIITNDIQKIQKDKQFALYTCFLNVKARIISDAIIFHPNIFKKATIQKSKEQYWIDIHKDQKTKLLDHIKKYTWKKNVQVFEIESPAKIYAVYNHQTLRDSSYQMAGTEINSTYADIGDQNNYSNITYYDPRFAKMGLRLIAEPNTFSISEFDEKQLQVYQSYLTLMGIAQGSIIVDKLPFQFNIDILNGISFNKGCYLGQQLISRSYHTGVVRKRIYPFIIQNKSEQILVDQQLKNEKQVVIGKILFKKQDVGLALIDYLNIQDQQDIKIKRPFIGRIIRPYEDLIQSYITLMKQKQQNISKLM